MLFFLTNKKDSPIYLLPNRSYTVGRKESDILIAKDDSISRKHAVFAVTEEAVTIKDCGSRYGTFVNEERLTHEVVTVLTPGSTLKFGILYSVYKFNGVAVVTTTSGIKREGKAQLCENISMIGGVVVQNLSEQCTHVTVEELMLTVKVLSAVITNVPIVKLSYWDDYVKCVKNNKSLPNPLDYTLKCCEPVLKDLTFEYKEQRKTLFKNKIFLFLVKKDKVNMGNLIELAGGECISWDDTNPVTIDQVTNDIAREYLLIQSSEIFDIPKTDKSLLDFINSYNQTGKRTIPLQEIALAIINCSCEKDCNPKFNRKSCVFKTSTQKHSFSENMLAMPTQSHDLDSIPLDVKSELIIPQSDALVVSEIDVIKHSLDDDVVETKLPETTPIEVDDTSSSLKRESESNHTERNSKKVKVEENESFETNINTTIPKQESSLKAVPGSSLFAFKHEKIGSRTPDSSSNSSINPFAKKRKAGLDDTLNPTKKSAFGTLTPVSTEKSNSSLVINPFSNILKSRNPKDHSKISSTPKTKSNSRTSATIANSLEIDFSAITAVDKNLEKSFGWISKSNGTKSSFTFDSSIDKENESSDQDLLVFIKAFRNAVVIEKDSSLIVRKSGPAIVSNNGSHNENGVQNYKKFKKVPPLRIQTVIVPESSYVSIVCDHNNEHELIKPESEDEVDTQEMPKGKKKGKQYTL